MGESTSSMLMMVIFFIGIYFVALLGYGLVKLVKKIFKRN